VAGTRWPVLVLLDFVRTKLILNVLYYEKLVPSGVFFFKGKLVEVSEFGFSIFLVVEKWF
jgi:hypothetical protein